MSTRKQSNMSWWYDNSFILIVLAIVGGFILGMILFDMFYITPIREERKLKEDIMYKELCLDEKFYYLDSHAQECYKRGIKP